MVYKLIRAPMKYFDKTPSGDIISKFSNDLGLLDYSISFYFAGFLTGLSIIIVMLINVF
jgi:ATP-binding cassette subfamily B protein AbcA/BmrA